MRIATINFILHSLLLPLLIRSVEVHDQVGKDAVNQFPITLPSPIKNPSGPEPYVPANNDNPCLLYIESLSVVVFNMERKWSAWADIGSPRKDTTKYGGEMKCPDLATHGKSYGQQFTVSLNVDSAGAPGYRRGDKKEKGKKLFQVNHVQLELTFNYTQPNYWELVEASASSITIESTEKQEVPKMEVDGSWKTVSGRSSSNKKEWLTTDNKPPAWNMNGFKDYSFACAQTSPIVWANPKDDKNQYAVGVTFNNIQLQPFNATYVGREGAPDKAKFGRKVNDCAPLFSTGTWMGLIVALLLISVLSFGFLMLNSVQTMDRFDDPKQKQLVINAKE